MIFNCQSARKNNLLALNSWEYGGGAKVVVKANSEQELLELHKRAKEAGVNCHLVVDAGRTQIPSGSRTGYYFMFKNLFIL